MPRPTEEQLEFFLRHEIPLSQVFDATGYSTGEYKAIMRELGMVVAIGVSPCARSGHTVRTRAGHCAQCGTHNLAFLRRFDDAGYVYVAFSESLQLVKVGTTSDTNARLTTLNYFGYGGAYDWSIQFFSHCQRAGRVEFLAQQALWRYVVWRDYVKQGESVRCQELFKCPAKGAIAAVKNVLESSS